MPNVRVILASSSPRRKQLLQSLNLTFDIRPPKIQEDYTLTLPPSQIVEYVSRKKASSVAQEEVMNRKHKKENVLVIGSDTVVVVDNEILGKPVDVDDAQRMLHRLSGRSHHVYSGLALIHIDEGGEVKHHVGHEKTEVFIRHLNQEEIKRYVATGEPLDKAGSYAIQGYGATLVEKINGDYFTVVGFPVGLFSRLLQSAGYRLY